MLLTLLESPKNLLIPSPQKIVSRKNTCKSPNNWNFIKSKGNWLEASNAVDSVVISKHQMLWLSYDVLSCLINNMNDYQITHLINLTNKLTDNASSLKSSEIYAYRLHIILEIVRNQDESSWNDAKKRC